MGGEGGGEGFVATEQSYLIVDVMRTLCGLEAQWVEETLPLVELKPIAGLGAGYLGAIDRRGKLLPVVDLADCLGLARSPYGLSDAIVVLRSPQGVSLGLIVNEAVDLQGVMLDPDPSLLVAELSAQAREIVRDVVLLAGQPIALINSENLFTVLQRPEWHQSPLDSATDRWQTLSAMDQALLRARAVELAEADRADSDQGGQPWIVVEIGGERFGIDAAAVRELAELPVIVHLPCCPSHVLGNANLRGEIVTAIDISPWLGQERRPAVTRSLVAIVQVEDLTVGLAIDRAIETQWVSAQRLAPVPFNASTAEQLAPVNGSLDSAIVNRDNTYIRGIHVNGGQATSWLDVATLLRDPSLVVNESL